MQEENRGNFNPDENQKLDLEKKVKKQFGFDVDISKMGISDKTVTTALMDLLNKEREKHNAKIESIWVRAFLVQRRRVFGNSPKYKLRLRTIWKDENNFLQQSPKEHTLGYYTSIDTFSGGAISRLFCQIISEFQSGNVDKIPNVEDASIFFQFSKKDKETKLEVNFVNGKNPNNVIEEIDFKTIFDNN